MSNIVKTHALTKKYRSIPVVSGVDVTIDQGEIYALVGENGAGKSTLMKMLSGLAKPSSGEVILFENKNPEVMRYRIGCLIDSPALDGRLNVKNNLVMFAKAYGCYTPQLIDQTLELIGLTNHTKKAVSKLSLGMKQRLAIGIALLGSPDLLILDEPVNGLDPIGIQEIRQLLLKLKEERNTTILISSHLLDEVSKIATKYGFMKNGHLIKEITAAELAEKSRTCLKLRVSDVSKAAMICETALGTKNYEVLNAESIRIFDHVEEPAKVNEAMILGGVSVLEILRAGETLEEFFNELMVGGQSK